MSPTATATRTPRAKAGARTKAGAARSRQPKGTPTGGEFAAEVNAEGGDVIAAPTTVWSKWYDSPEEKVTAYLEELNSQVDDLKTDQGWKDYLSLVASVHKYSLNNLRLIHFQKPDASIVMSKTAWRALGRWPAKGSKQINILRPKTVYAVKKDAAGNPVIVDGKPVKEKKMIGWTGCGVFDVSQTDGEPLPQTDWQTLSEEPPAGFIDDLETAIKNAGFTLDYQETRDGSYGYTTADGSKRVVVRPGMTAGSTARVLAHELGHIAAGHLEKAADGEYHTGAGGHRGEMEVEADSISYALLRANGMSPDAGRGTAAYVTGWGTHAERSDEAVRRVAANVTKAVVNVIGENSWRNVYDPSAGADDSE